jgi:hypothetical protein
MSADGRDDTAETTKADMHEDHEVRKSRMKIFVISVIFVVSVLF